ncbi:hypothetical protein [Bacteroides sp. CACC 737]|uniref:hypothetical protein n=1 Tax=Bacteroides sp. CACC 737 TaxID=2755405 RepID=UPI0021083589|nr:hypothetical protein [Bacteroides sp. CACC 737]
MRLWLDPIKMSGYGITPLDVKNAVDNEKRRAPFRKYRRKTTTELTIRTLGLMPYSRRVQQSYPEGRR